MRLDRLTPALIRRAVQIYLDHAWPLGEGGEPPISVADLEGATTLDELTNFFDRPRRDQSPLCKRFTLRLGNHRYRFMKFVVQEYLVPEEYFFSVDTHDDLTITPDMPDYAGWQELRAYNRVLKLEIERAWNDADLPTNEDLRLLMENLAELEPSQGRRERLLVVDDEKDVAQGLAACLRARGYLVEVAYDGRQVLDRIDIDPLPDLVLLDYSMPEYDGQEVIERIRNDKRCQDLPILLATATSIELSALQPSCGLLRKPYPRQVLYAMIDQLLAKDGREPSNSPTP
jgi:CheY-like chemotaxis protein